MQQKMLVQFGAGKIGRSFIAQLFALSGYRVTFVDIDEKIINELNKRHNYSVIIRSNEENRVLNIPNVGGVHFQDQDTITETITEADIASISVGKKALSEVLPVLAKGIQKRYKQYPQAPLDIILAENMHNAAEYVTGELQKYLPSDFPVSTYLGLIETSIGKMVPIMRQEDVEADILQVFAEPYNTLILDKKAFKNPIPDVEGLAPKDNMKAWVDRKIFIHNLGHAAAAYAGYLYNPAFTYVYEVMETPLLEEYVRKTMKQSAEILQAKYPGEFNWNDLTEHIEDLIQRFKNRALGDTVYRVGRDLFRKLGPEDRLVQPIKEGIKLNKPLDYLLAALVFGFYFRKTDEHGQLFPQDEEFIQYFQQGVTTVMEKICGFDPEKDCELIERAQKLAQQIDTISDFSMILSKDTIL